MLDTTLGVRERHGVSEQPEAVLPDAGYWHTAQMQAITERGIEVLIPPDGNMREGTRPGWERGLYELMRRKLTSERGRKLYAQPAEALQPLDRRHRLTPADPRLRDTVRPYHRAGPDSRSPHFRRPRDKAGSELARRCGRYDDVRPGTTAARSWTRVPSRKTRRWVACW